jgi:hypothetical protein
MSLLWVCKPVSVLLEDQLPLAGPMHRGLQNRPNSWVQMEAGQSLSQLLHCFCGHSGYYVVMFPLYLHVYAESCQRENFDRTKRTASLTELHFVHYFLLFHYHLTNKLIKISNVFKLLCFSPKLIEEITSLQVMIIVNVGRD